MDGKKLVQKWIDTLEKHDSKNVVKLYSKNGILLGTLAPVPLVGKEQIKTYFDDFVNLHPLGEIVWHYNQKLGCGRIVVDGNYDFELDDKDNEGKRKDVEARFTFVFKRNWIGKWKILTHHSSEKPTGHCDL